MNTYRFTRIKDNTRARTRERKSYVYERAPSVLYIFIMEYSLLMQYI